MNLLVDPVFRVITSKGLRSVSLPELLATLGRETVTCFPALQRYQEEAFHIFLCYLAGAVLASRGLQETRQSARFWRQEIRRLTGRADDFAWTLVVDDVTKPAFLQPPLRSAKCFGSFRLKATMPHALDVLQTAKNHDVKSKRGGDDPEFWALALVSLQTSAGHLGYGNYGIARMNGGFGSRCSVSFVPDERMDVRWRRDVAMLLDSRDELRRPPNPYRKGIHRWLWLLPWDGESSLPLTSLDPYFIEIARRVRLRNTQNGIVAYSTPTKQSRIAAQELKGSVGDPWIPTNERTQGALTVSAAGFTPDLVRSLIFSDGFLPGPAQRPRAGETVGWLRGCVLVRGQGKTDGFHETRVRIPREALLVLIGTGPQRDRLAQLSKWAVRAAGDMEYRVLRLALLVLMKAGPRSLDLPDRGEVGRWIQHMSGPFLGSWARHYFDWLWRTLETADELTAQREWLRVIRVAAENALHMALRGAPTRGGRRYRARACAFRTFYGSLHSVFGTLLGKPVDVITR